MVPDSYSGKGLITTMQADGDMMVASELGKSEAGKQLVYFLHANDHIRCHSS